MHEHGKPQKGAEACHLEYQTVREGREDLSRQSTAVRANERREDQLVFA